MKRNKNIRIYGMPLKQNLVGNIAIYKIIININYILVYWTKELNEKLKDEVLKNGTIYSIKNTIGWGINLTEDVKDLYPENYKMSLKLKKT